MSYKIDKFKDGQVSSKVEPGTDLDISIRGNSYEDLFSVASVKEAWDEVNRMGIGHSLKSTLRIKCLIGQRSDRRFNEGESFDLKIIARFINSMNFNQVVILHPHSSVTTALINNSVAEYPLEIIKKVYESHNNLVLVSPDAGAYKLVSEIAASIGADLVPSNKVRVNGEPKIEIQGDVIGRDCLIVDDLADGGRTFVELSKALGLQGAKKVFLWVTHGQFNYGLDQLVGHIDRIYCTNSYRDIVNELVGQFKVI